MLPMKQVTVLTVIGSFIVVLAAIFLGVFPVIVNSIVGKMLVVRPNSSTIDDFITPPVPIYMQFWLFNVTNPNEIRFNGARPSLKEIGPYTYEEVRTKHDLHWNDKDGTVSYLQDKSFFFKKDMSGGRLETDNITTINPLMVAIAAKVEKLPFAVQLVVELAFLRFEESLFITKSVGELLFKGYDAPLLAELIKYAGDPTNSKGKFGFFYPVIADFFDKQEYNEILGTIWTEIEVGFDLFSTLPIGDMLFYGFPLPEFDFDFSDLGGNFTITGNLTGTLYEILEQLYELEILENPPPESLAGNKINYMKNNTDDQIYEVKTGAKGLDDYLHIVKWNGSDHLKYWSDQYCDMINGTDGSQYPPQVSKDQVLYLYTSELCRSLYLTYEEEQDVHGINTYKFIPPKAVLEDPMVNEDNQCFCYPDTENCLGASMLNMAPCAFEAPIVLSTPHFYQGNQGDIDSIEGLDPRKEEHETTINVEPTTGVALRAMKKMQLNIPLRRYGNLPSFKAVPEVIFPLVWVNESAKIDSATAEDLKKAIYLPFTIVDAICGTLIGIGAILLLVGAYKFSRIRRARNQQKI